MVHMTSSLYKWMDIVYGSYVSYVVNFKNYGALNVVERFFNSHF